jgi:hypothetical protein
MRARRRQLGGAILRDCGSDCRGIASRASNGVPASYDRIDHFGDGPVPFHFEFGANGILMGRCGVAKNPHDLVLRQHPTIVQGKQERLAD